MWPFPGDGHARRSTSSLGQDWSAFFASPCVFASAQKRPACGRITGRLPTASEGFARTSRRASSNFPPQLACSFRLATLLQNPCAPCAHPRRFSRPLNVPFSVATCRPPAVQRFVRVRDRGPPGVWVPHRASPFRRSAHGSSSCPNPEVGAVYCVLHPSTPGTSPS